MGEESLFGLLGDTGEYLTAALRGYEFAVWMPVESAPFLKTVQGRVVFKDKIIDNGPDLLVGVGETPV